MHKYKSIIAIILRYAIILGWSFYEFVTLNNYLCAVVYEEVFPNGFSESDILNVAIIPNVINKFYYLILFLVIVYLLLVIIRFRKAYDLKESIKDIILLIGAFIVIIIPRYWICHTFMLDELYHLRIFGLCLGLGIIILLIMFAIKKSSNKVIE